MCFPDLLNAQDLNTQSHLVLLMVKYSLLHSMRLSHEIEYYNFSLLNGFYTINVMNKMRKIVSECLLCVHVFEKPSCM